MPTDVIPMNLKEKLEKRLAAGKFRFINERLYKNSGIKLDDSLLSIYHSGFQHQSRKWKEKPIDLIKNKLKKTQVIVDMGCGEAEISTHFPLVASFDMYPVNNRAIQCDIANIPLKDKSADVVVFCLSLMMENICKPVKEGNRVLRNKGKLLIAEVASRIENIEELIRNIEKVGFRMHEKYSNNYFVLIEFIKIKDSREDHKILLKPCVYKKR